MSRSRKKNSITGNTGASDKKAKRFANRMFRKRAKNKIKQEKFDECPINMNEVMTEWEFPKDGKKYYSKFSKWFKDIIRK